MTLCKELPKGLRIAQWNVQCITNKIDQLKTAEILRCPGTQVDILGLSETWLNSKYAEGFAQAEGWSIFRRDRSQKEHGGSLLFVNNKFQHLRRYDLENDDIEAIWIEFAFPNTRPIILCHGYRPEWVNVRDWSEKIEERLERVFAENKEVIIMGDLNIDWKDIDKNEYQPWKELLIGFQLSPVSI